MQPGSRRADVVIIGSALGGLVAGAILTRRGKRVVVLEHADSVGGGAGGTSHDGYWIDFGHRDGHDVGDCQLTWHHGAEAAREAGVALELRRIAPSLRVHFLPDGVAVDASWGAEGFLRAAREVFECPPDGLGELSRALGIFAAAGPAEAEDAIPCTLGDWLPRHVPRADVRQAILRMAAVIFHRHPEEASVGRLMQFFQAPKAGPFIADDDEAGGMQGLMLPWARAIRDRGGEIALGWKPVEIVADGGRVCGAVAVNRANLVLEVEAPVVISTYPVWENFALVDERHFPRRLVEDARELEKHRADLIGWQAGLRRLPRIRATGQPEHHAGWNRFLRGTERAYHGGYQLTSMSSRRSAPPGKHLLSLSIVRWFRGGSTAGQPWTVARADVDEAVSHLRRFYADLDECIEWSSYHYASAPQSMSWFWAPVKRHPLTIPSIHGLFLAGSTLEAPAGIVDLAAFAGLRAAHGALAQLEGSG